MPAHAPSITTPATLFATERIPALLAEHGSPLLMLSTDIIAAQYELLRTALPNVDIYYAIKAQSHPAVLRRLSSLGCHFDVCSNGEIDLVTSLNISAARCMHTHPIKRDSDIHHALDFGCDTFIFDNLDELNKFAPYAQSRTDDTQPLKLILRLGFRSPHARVDLSLKFGAPPEDAIDLISAAHTLGLNIHGLSFHVGSQNLDPSMYITAINTCKRIFDNAAAIGIPLQMLDIGGGFPIAYTADVPAIHAFCEPIRHALNESFHQHHVICEPGRFIAGPAMQLISTIVGTSTRQNRPWYYLDDGVYGSYSGKISDHATYPIYILDSHGTIKDTDENSHQPSVLAGPTCDSFDIIDDNILLPPLPIGTLLASPSMGAYCSVTASDFNLFPKAHIHCID